MLPLEAVVYDGGTIVNGLVPVDHDPVWRLAGGGDLRWVGHARPTYHLQRLRPRANLSEEEQGLLWTILAAKVIYICIFQGFLLCSKKDVCIPVHQFHISFNH